MSVFSSLHCLARPRGRGVTMHRGAFVCLPCPGMRRPGSGAGVRPLPLSKQRPSVLFRRPERVGKQEIGRPQARSESSAARPISTPQTLARACPGARWTRTTTQSLRQRGKSQTGESPPPCRPGWAFRMMCRTARGGSHPLRFRPSRLLAPPLTCHSPWGLQPPPRSRSTSDPGRRQCQGTTECRECSPLRLRPQLLLHQRAQAACSSTPAW